MLYTLLIYENAEELATDPEAQRKHAAEFGEFVAAVADKIRGGAPLKLPEDGVGRAAPLDAWRTLAPWRARTRRSSGSSATSRVASPRR